MHAVRQHWHSTVYPHSWLACERCAVAQQLRTRSQNAGDPDDAHFRTCELDRQLPLRGTAAGAPLCPYEHRGPGRASKRAKLWTFLASLEEPQIVDKNLDSIKDTLQEPIPQPSGEAGSRSGANDTTCTAATADEGFPPAHYSHATEPELAEQTARSV